MEKSQNRKPFQALRDLFHPVDLTHGTCWRTILQFSLPVILSYLLQQVYTISDAAIVGQTLTAQEVAGVNDTASLVFIFLQFAFGVSAGFCVITSCCVGCRDQAGVRRSMAAQLVLSAGLTVLLTALALVLLNPMLAWINVTPENPEVYRAAYTYCGIIFAGIGAQLFYNFICSFLRSMGDSVTPLLFLLGSTVLNVALDLLFILVLHWGVRGAAAATTFSQFVSGIGIGLYTLKKFPQLCPKKEDCRWDKQNLATILNLSVMTSVQQSIMNFGILMVQGLVNSFGTVIMAAFAAAVKIDSFAYMPVQDFGNAFSTYVAQNYGAGQTDRIRKGIRSAGLCSAAFCIVISVLVCAFAAPLMGIFIDPAETAILAAGVHYLHIEGACYLGIGILFLLYGYYRAVNQPQMSVVLTIASLGTRVALAYLLSATPLGVTGIWLSVPIGWALADAIGIGYYLKKHRAKYAVQA